jgi:hypothetical protein
MRRRHPSKGKHMKDESLKLVLEALESCGEGHITDGGTQWHDAKLVDKAITAIKQAPPAQPAVPDAIIEAGESPDYRDGWNDCRAEMLEMRKP